MMKSLRRRSWIDAGNSFLIAWMQKSHHSSLGTLVAFRKRLIDQQMDRRLIERTIELASQSQTFGPRPLRAALDSSPLWGAGRVEDTYNLVGHALKKVMRVVADQQERELAEVASEAGAELVCGSSLKATLDRDWDQQIQKDEALALVLQVLHTVETWVQRLTDPEDKIVADPVGISITSSEWNEHEISPNADLMLGKIHRFLGKRPRFHRFLGKRL